MADRMEKASEPRASTEANNNERKQICLAPFSLEKKDLVAGQKGFALTVAKLEGQGVSQEEKDTLDEQRVSLEAVRLELVDSREMVELEEASGTEDGGLEKGGKGGTLLVPK